MAAECAVAPSVLYVDKPIWLAVNDPEWVVTVGGYPQEEGGLAFREGNRDEVAIEVGGQGAKEVAIFVNSEIGLSLGDIVNFDVCSIGGFAEANPFCEVSVATRFVAEIVDASGEFFDGIVPVERIVAGDDGWRGG